MPHSKPGDLRPAERCGIEIDNVNKWSGLLLNSIENERQKLCS